MESISEFGKMLDKLVFNGTIDNWRLFHKRETGIDFVDDISLVFILFFGKQTAILIPPVENMTSSKRVRRSIIVGKVDLASKKISEARRFYNTNTLPTNLAKYLQLLRHNLSLTIHD